MLVIYEFNPGPNFIITVEECGVHFVKSLLYKIFGIGRMFLQNRYNVGQLHLFYEAQKQLSDIILPFSPFIYLLRMKPSV